MSLHELGVLLLACACAAEEQRPPEYQPDGGAVPNPRSCGEVRGGGTPDELFVMVDAERAQCLGEGVVCSLADVSAFDAECVIGSAAAVCLDAFWRVRCELSDAGTSENDASSSDAAGTD